MKIAYPFLLLALLAPATASAQTPPPDERAAAQAMADAAKRYADAIKAPSDRFVESLDHPARRPAGCPRIAKKHREDAFVLLFVNRALEWFRDLKPPTRAMRSELANVPTADPVLISGRAAFRAVGRYFEAAPEPIDACATLRAWRRTGYAKAILRRALGDLEWPGEPGRSAERKLAAAVDRMVELGVSRDEASLFADPFPEPEERWGGS